MSVFANSQTPVDSLVKYIPEGYLIFEKTLALGDLNKDGILDYVIITKGTNKNKLITDKNRGELDLNRRGIVILHNKKDGYEKVVLNMECFHSEDEDGGIYYPPELSVDIKKGILYIHFSHGRYGWWRYTFRYQNSQYELIGYDSNTNSGPVVKSQTSINFSTRKKLIKKNTYTSGEFEDPIFEETWKEIQITELIKLSEIQDFAELNVYDF